MKILFLSSWYPTFSNPNSGIFVKEHAHAIKTAGNEIIVLAIVISRSKKIWSKSVTDAIDENGIRTVTIEVNSRFRDLIYHLIPLQYILTKNVYIKYILPDFDPDIVHSNVVFPAGIIGNQLSEYLKKPHIITEHWSRLRAFMKKPLFSNLALQSYKKAVRILPVSGFLKNNMVEVLPGIDPLKLRVVGNVIDSDIFYYKDKKVNPDYIRFCAVATWANKKVPDKSPELFINALAQWQHEIKQSVLLTMIGGGDKVNELKELCLEKGLKAEFLGYQTKSEIAKYLQASDFFVHASSIETFGIVVAEALLCGTPVICSNVGALPELVNRSNGILCDNLEEEWVKAIQKAISTKFNNADIAAKVKMQFSKNAIGEKISIIYRDVIENRAI